MLKIVFWGDSHIPYRADALPQEFLNFVKTRKPNISVITGDLVRISVLEKIRGLVSKIIAVRGNMDEGEAAELPIVEDLDLGSAKATIYHGHGIYPRGDPKQLYDIAKHRQANIIITGHTHYPQITRYSDVWILNPGSVCGVLGGSGGYGRPTWGFMLVEDDSIRVEIFELLPSGQIGVYDSRTLKI